MNYAESQATDRQRNAFDAATRTIHITRQDMDRLRFLIKSIQSSKARDDRDRPYLWTLESELDRAVVVNAEEVPPDVVTMNSRVRLQDGPMAWIVTLVFPEDADPEHDRISVLAPLGAALLGCHAGTTTSFRVPGGSLRSCEVMSVLYQPEAAGDMDL
ncbi:MAG: nucleoside diphosphate kinase regulator [Phycisphaerales bacterium]|nr:nucleoside diphosphate kinase regulator [Phycisphaerales bacterium]